MRKNLIHGNQKNGMKIFIHLVRPISEKGLKNLPIQIRKSNQLSYFPLKPVLFANFKEINNEKRICTFVYNNFGASEEGVVYRIRYWRAVSRLGRRLKGLCTIKLYDLPDGNFKYEMLDDINLQRFSWYKQK